MAHVTSAVQGGAAPSPLSAANPLLPKPRFQVGLQGTTGVLGSDSIAFSSVNAAVSRSGSAEEPAENPRRAVLHTTAEFKNDPSLQLVHDSSFPPQNDRPDGANVSMPDSLHVPKSSLYSDLFPNVRQSNADSIPGTGSDVIPSQNSVSGPSLDSLLMPPPDSARTVPSGVFSVVDPVLVGGTGSLSSLGPGIPPPRFGKPQALDTLSYLDSVSLMSGTMESLTCAGLGDDVSSLGSDSEINGVTFRKTDKYGFMEGNQNFGGESSISVEVARQREMKWLDMFRHWEKCVQQRFQKVKLRCRKGIPSSLRARAWQYLSNSYDLLQKNPGKFEDLERQPGDPKWLDIIEKDLHRQFPFHEMFAARGGHGQQDLYRILKAYTIYKPDEGYCQAQAPVAAVLLMHMPAEQAFWCLVQICDKYLPGYYSAGLEAIQLDGEVFFALLRRTSSIAYRHLKRYKIDPILYMTEWFMCIFSRTLPWASVLRIWDMFFCEGVKIVFRVGLVLLRSTLGAKDKLRDCQGMYETMEKLRNIPVQYMQEDYLAHEVINLPVTESLIERESGIQRKKWEGSRGELQHKPSRRLYGCQAIHEEKHRMNPPLSSSVSFLSITSLKKLKDDKKDKSKILRDQKSFIPMPLVGSIAEHPTNHSLISSTAVNLSVNNASKPTKEEKREDVESGKQEPKKDVAEKYISSPLISVNKTSHEPPELTVQVVSEGLRPSLPSPTANITPLGEPKKSKDDRKKEKDLEKQRVKEQKEKEKQKEKEQKEREKQLKLEKEKEKKLQKEKGKEDTKLKKEKKSKQKDQPETAETAKDKSSQKSETKEDGVSGTKGYTEKGAVEEHTGAATAVAQKSTDAQNVSGPSSNLSSAGELQATYF